MLKQKNKGFTLIELLVVVAIIAILSAVVITAINSAREKGKDSAVISQMNQARNQAEIYYTKKGNYTGLCDSDNPDGIYPLIEAATKTIGFEENTREYIVAQTVNVYQQYGNTFSQSDTEMSNMGKSRCRVSDNILMPLWAAHVPLLRKSRNGAQQYYCVDSTGAGVVTTGDFARNEGMPLYLMCIE